MFIEPRILEKNQTDIPTNFHFTEARSQTFAPKTSKISSSYTKADRDTIDDMGQVGYRSASQEVCSQPLRLQQTVTQLWVFILLRQYLAKYSASTASEQSRAKRNTLEAHLKPKAPSLTSKGSFAKCTVTDSTGNPNARKLKNDEMISACNRQRDLKKAFYGTLLKYN
ncbi:hypothetical protein RF11_10296 [Thelohanellus kitauei]|uniref:Uncharacterized protein n=1 Tax=Thelohanellus kitauei TaxID=669202 RepID=A0A0C2JEI4_THEKT|nr:hypothetical protein RF11_10296 [Thelohanellus kitauei]